MNTRWLVIFALALSAACSDASTGDPTDTTGASADSDGEAAPDTIAADTSAGPADIAAGPADTAASGGATGDSLPSTGDDAPCETHSDCVCPSGVCFATTGLCWCPPCETDDDCQAGQSCHNGNCVTINPACAEPPRVTPDQGPSSGGTLVAVQGMSFYIGALEWFMQIGDGPAVFPLYSFDLGVPPCTMMFVVPPMPPGTYPVWVTYGWPGDELPGDPATAIGTFTVYDGDEPTGDGFCRSSGQCDSWQRCDLGTFSCVPALCSTLWCSQGDSCDDIEGCLAADQACATAADCKLLDSSCFCHAVHSSDPREGLEACVYGGCDDCTENQCEAEHVEAVCAGGTCTERRADPQGPSCATLEPTALEPTFAAPGHVLGLRAIADTSLDTPAIALAWTEPQVASFRYGVIRVARFDRDGQPLGPVAELHTGGEKSSQVDIAVDDVGLAVVWLSEDGPAQLVFQRIDESGAPVGSPEPLASPADVWTGPRLLTAADPADGFDLFRMRYDYGPATDGLYVDTVSPLGVLTEGVHHPWLVVHNNTFEVVRTGAANWILWPTQLTGFEGTWLTPLPPVDDGLVLVAEQGAVVDAASTGQGVGAVWRQSGPQGTASVWFGAFDQARAPLTLPVRLNQGPHDAWGPRVSYLGGVFVATWRQETDAAGTSEAVHYRVLEESGHTVAASTVAPLDTMPPLGFGGAHVRLDDELLTIHGSTAPSETLRFLRWTCTE